MRFGIHVFSDERKAAEALLAAGFLPIGRESTQHYRNPERDADRWVRRADVQKAGPDETRVHVWRAFK
jgi:cell division septal protein FtsQ